MTQRYDVVIIGGGVAGGALAAALASENGDARVLLVEQTRRSGAINRGHMIWPTHMELLERWGVLDEMYRRGAATYRYNEFRDHDGNLLLRHDFAFYQSRYDRVLILEHPEIEESLLHVAGRNPNLTIWRGARFEGLADHDESGATVLLHQGGEAVQVRASWVVGADGRQSRVREAAGIGTTMYPYPYELLMTYVPKDPRWADSCVQFVGPRGFLGIFAVNGPNDRLALPLPAGSFLAFMKQSEEERQAEVSRRAAWLREAPVLWEQSHNYKLYRHHAAAYHRGRVILVGDAVHTFTPMLGMGMNLAFEEAETLAKLLAHRHLRERLSHLTLQQAYEGRRRPRSRRILMESTRQGDLQVGGGALWQAAFRAGLRLAARFPALRTSMMRYTFAV